MKRPHSIPARRCLWLLASLAAAPFLSAQTTEERNAETRENVREALEEARSAAAEAREIARLAAEEARRAVSSWSWSSADEKERGPEPYVGVTIESVPGALRRYVDLPPGIGLLLVKVHKGSPADKAGLQNDDIMIQFNDQLIANFSQFSTLVNLHEEGDVVPVKVIRKGGEVTVDLVIEERVRKGNRWLTAPEPPDAPAPPAPPNAPAPPEGDEDEVGRVAPGGDAEVEERIITRHLPSNVRIITGEGNEMEIDLSQLKSSLENLEERLGHIEIHRDGKPMELEMLVERLQGLGPIIRGTPEEGPRQSIVHMGDTSLSLNTAEGRVRIYSEAETRYALVTDPQGVVLFDGELPEDLEQSDLPPRAKELIESLLETTERVDFDLDRSPDLPVELEVDEAEQLTQV